MQKLDMESKNLVQSNIDKLKEFLQENFPSSVNEGGIDIDALKQELSTDVIDSYKERYQLTWPGKKEAIATANSKCNKTLRPVRERSVDFDKTENIYIEGDNLEALKILQESYLNKIKCIYIDPPYNTGNDFVYDDNFYKKSEQELVDSGIKDKNGNILISEIINSGANGKFHSSWLSMMYPRLKLARNLLTDDGVIFISIDDNECSNLKKICDEIFGEKNYIETFSRTKTETPANLAKMTKKAVEYILCYSKSSNVKKFIGLQKDSKSSNGLMNQTNNIKTLVFPKNIVDTAIKDGIIKAGKYGTSSYEIVLEKDTEVINGYFSKEIILTGRFKWTQEKLDEEIKKGTKISIRTEALSPSYEKETYDPETPWNIINSKFGVGTNENASSYLRQIFGGKIFDFPKPTSLLKYLFNFLVTSDDIVLDFFSGSATSADAILQLNSGDGGNRKFIMVQLPEVCDSGSEAYRLGYKNICDIGEDRIRKAGDKIKEETNADIDYGFRVYKVDSSNMKDVFYKPGELDQNSLFDSVSNIKEDRFGEDILTQVILDLGLPLDLKIEEKKIGNHDVFFVEENYLIACFGDKLDLNIVEEIAKYEPKKVVFKDSSFKSDQDKINLQEKFKRFSPSTEINIL